MKFHIKRAKSPLKGTVVYRSEEFAFDTVPSPSDGHTTIVLDDINLEVDEGQRVIGIWGLCPHTRWKEHSLTPPEATNGELFVRTETPLHHGVARRLTPVGQHLDTFVDRTSGWIKVNHLPQPKTAVRVLENAIVELDDACEVSALWIKPGNS